MPTEHDWSEILENWYADTRINEDNIAARMAWWFGPDEGRDRQLQQQYQESCIAALNGELGHWQAEPQSRLALILLLDQFPRNLFRGTPRAFAGDDRAAMLCLSGVQAGMDQELKPAERVFFYMTLQHAEDVVTQKVSVELFRQLASEQAEISTYEAFAGYAQLHLDLIERFGRFPHRNEILGRTSTAEETRYLEEGGERFGQ